VLHTSSQNIGGEHRCYTHQAKIKGVNTGAHERQAVPVFLYKPAMLLILR